MTIYELRDLLETCSIEDLPLRCATYSRVSTEKETQAASLVNMTDDFREYVDAHENWTFVRAYIDDGVTGLSTKKRDDFMKLLIAGAAGEYDLLVTGEVSRFGRNTLEGLQNIQVLKNCGIPVLFLYDDLNTYDPDCDMRIQEKLVDAENESHKISKRVKRGHSKSIKKGHVLGNRMWGYKKVNCKLQIDEKTAPMVRRIFELYATNNHSMKEIETILYDEGWRNTNGNKLSHTTMANIITNPKYKGYYVGGKVKIIDLYSKKQKFLSQEDWTMFKDESGDIVPALVSEELWEKANEVFSRRSKDVKGRRNCSTHKNTYTGKLFCTLDGAPYYCKDVHYKGTDISKWICSHKTKNGADSCRSGSIYEDELNKVVLETFDEFRQNADTILAEYITQYKTLFTGDVNYKQERERLTRELLAIEEQQDELVEMKLNGEIPPSQFKRLMAKKEEKISKINLALDDLEHSEELITQVEEQITRLQKALEKGLESLEDGIITRDFVDNYIKRIDITPLNNNQIRIEIQGFTGDVIERTYQKIRGRTGQTFKKMIEAYENSMK